MNKIEEAAKLYAKDNYGIGSYTGNCSRDSFVDGAVSPEAKEFHTRGLYSESEVLNLVVKSFTEGFYCGTGKRQKDFNIFNWFEQNKKK